MLKKLLLLPLAVVMLTAAVSAEDAAPENLLAGYASAEWEGDALSYENEHGTLSFVPVDGRTEYSAEYSVSVPESAEGAFFCVDIGNYYNLTGGALDAGGAVVYFKDESGAILQKASTENASENQYFHRYLLGTEQEYLRLPEGTREITVRLMGTYRGAGTFRLYFRSFALRLGSTDNMSNAAIFAKSDKLAMVQVGVNRFTQLVWIGIVVVVAFAFLMFRKYKDRNRRLGG